MPGLGTYPKDLDGWVPSRVWHVSIPFEPAPKERHRTNRNGHVWTPTATQWAEYCIREAALRVFAEPLRTPVRVRIVSYLSAPKLPKKSIGRFLHQTTPDVDNLAKAATDGLRGAAYVDDKQIVSLYIEKRYAWDGRPGWRISVYGDPAEVEAAGRWRQQRPRGGGRDPS